MLKALDDAARSRVFKRDAYCCLRCQMPARQIQWAHVIRRDKCLALKWDDQNALTLCAGCHKFWWHSDEVMAVDWFRKNFPERYDHIILTRQLNPKVNIRELYGALLQEQSQ